MSTDLTPERRAEIEAHRRIVEDCLSIPDADDPDGIVDRIMIRDVDDLLSAYDGMTRERDLLAETARRLTAERDAAVEDAERWRFMRDYVAATGRTFRGLPLNEAVDCAIRGDDIHYRGA